MIWDGHKVPVKRVVEIASTTRFIERAVENPYIWAADLTILPPDELIPAGFPVEEVRIFGDLIEPHVQLLGWRGRTWVHVYRRPWGRDLCLWTTLSEEPETLKWTPGDGWEQLFKIIQRHLVFEEVARRDQKRWPVEDAHGTPMENLTGRYRPPTSQAMAEARRWRKAITTSTIRSQK